LLVLLEEGCILNSDQDILDEDSVVYRVHCLLCESSRSKDIHLALLLGAYEYELALELLIKMFLEFYSTLGFNLLFDRK
jgi:hypothetical protein